jgi:hypothetical protein
VRQSVRRACSGATLNATELGALGLYLFKAMRTLSSGLLIVLFVACSAETPEEKQIITPLACLITENQQFDTVGWTRVDDRDFSFILPPGLEELQVRPVDSHVRVWRGQTSIREFQFDYGQFSDPLVRWTAADETVHSCEMNIGEYGLRLVTGHHESGGVYVAGAWRNVRPGTHLTVMGIAADTTGQRLLALILHSTEFHLQRE